MYAAINSISYEIPDLTMEVNVKGTLNLLEAPTLNRYNVSYIPTTALSLLRSYSVAQYQTALDSFIRQFFHFRLCGATN